VRQRHFGNVFALFSRLRSGGFVSENVGHWYGVPMLVTDARYLLARADRPRRGIGGWIAAWVAGEAVPLAALAPLLPSSDELEALIALGLAEDDRATLRPRVRVLPWHDVMIASPPADAFDVSALNVAASLPPAETCWDVGCGAGLVGIVAARAGARVFASDLDAELVEWVRLNAALNGVELECAAGDLFAAAPDRVCDVVAFNAPLLRAPLADAGDGPRYASTPEGERLALRFLDGARARERILLHAQLTPAVAAALDAWAARAAVTTVVFAHAPDGTPHALSEIRVGAAPGLRRVQVPLSAACPHLGREIFDALAPADARAIADDATPLPAPWLELRTSERFDGGRRALGTTFGGVAVDAEDVALLDRLRGEPLRALGLTSPARERLCVMVDRGQVILR